MVHAIAIGEFVFYDIIWQNTNLFCHGLYITRFLSTQFTSEIERICPSERFANLTTDTVCLWFIKDRLKPRLPGMFDLPSFLAPLVWPTAL
jgi:hypothetical protein